MKGLNVIIGILAIGIVALIVTSCSVGSTTPSSPIPNETQIDAVKNDIGNDLDDFKFAINGTVYSVSEELRVNDFTYAGWKLDTDTKNSYDPMPGRAKSKSFPISKKGGDGYPKAQIYLVVENWAPQSTSLDMCRVAEITIEASLKTNLILADGLSWDNTIEEFAKAYNLPADSYTNTDSEKVIIHYDEERRCYIYLYFYNDTSKLKSLELKFLM